MLSIGKNLIRGKTYSHTFHTSLQIKCRPLVISELLFCQRNLSKEAPFYRSAFHFEPRNATKNLSHDEWRIEQIASGQVQLPAKQERALSYVMFRYVPW